MDNIACRRVSAHCSDSRTQTDRAATDLNIGSPCPREKTALWRVFHWCARDSLLLTHMPELVTTNHKGAGSAFLLESWKWLTNIVNATTRILLSAVFIFNRGMRDDASIAFKYHRRKTKNYHFRRENKYM